MKTVLDIFMRRYSKMVPKNLRTEKQQVGMNIVTDNVKNMKIVSV